MLSLTHTITSLPVAVYFNHPVIIFIAAFVLHVLADSLLHWNIFPHLYKRYPVGLVALDVVGGVIIAWLLTDSAFFNVPILAAIAGGNAPDVLHALWDMVGPRSQQRWFAWAQPWFTFHDRVQLETLSPLKGLISQAVLVVAALALLQ